MYLPFNRFPFGDRGDGSETTTEVLHRISTIKLVGYTKVSPLVENETTKVNWLLVFLGISRVVQALADAEVVQLMREGTVG